MGIKRCFSSRWILPTFSFWYICTKMFDLWP